MKFLKYADYENIVNAFAELTASADDAGCSDDLTVVSRQALDRLRELMPTDASQFAPLPRVAIALEGGCVTDVVFPGGNEEGQGEYEVHNWDDYDREEDIPLTFHVHRSALGTGDAAWKKACDWAVLQNDAVFVDCDAQKGGAT